MSLYVLRLFDAWQPVTPDWLEHDLGQIAEGVNTIGRLAAYQVPKANVGLTMGLNGLRFTEPLTTPWVLVRDSDGVEIAPVTAADLAAPAERGVVLRGAAVAEVEVVPGDAEATVTAIAGTLNALLASLQASGAMAVVTQAKSFTVLEAASGELHGVPDALMRTVTVLADTTGDLTGEPAG